jgi:hypothetical protein
MSICERGNGHRVKSRLCFFWPRVRGLRVAALVAGWFIARPHEAKAAQPGLYFLPRSVIVDRSASASRRRADDRLSLI